MPSHRPLRSALTSTGDSPRSRRMNEQAGKRAKVTRACDRCKRRKIKCNGRQPCDFCNRARTKCTFEVAYRRGRAPSILSSPGHQTEGYLSQNEVPALGTQREVDLRSHNLESRPSILASSATLAHGGNQTLDPQDTSQPDLQGQYIGPSSGISFLLRIQKRLDQAISFSYPNSIFTFGDAPLKPLEADPSFCFMLSQNDAQRLVDRYFDFAMPTYRFLHRKTVQLWLDEFYETHGNMYEVSKAPAKIALLFLISAHGLVYMPDDDRPGPPNLSARFHQAAEHQLTKERGAVRLTSIQARLLQCFYLLTQSRINHCWSLFGTVSRLAISMGLNRNLHLDATSDADKIELEYSRRTFWCAYTLDIYLSVALGRARAFHDEDIDATIPQCIEDSELTRPAGELTSPKTDVSVILARIISNVLRDLYCIKPVSADLRAVLVERISKTLSDWRVEQSEFLDVPYLSTSYEAPIYQRQRNVLNLTYWHAIILIHRPSVLQSISQSIPQGRNILNSDSRTEESIQQCLRAATNTVETIDEITNNRQMFRVFWTTVYFAFTASIVLYVYVIQRQDLSAEAYNEYLSAATRCQNQISGISEKGSLSERYCLLLDELRIEAIRRTGHLRSVPVSLPETQMQPYTSGAQVSAMRTDHNHVSADDDTRLMDDVQNDMDDFLSTGLASIEGWDQFTSMVSSGLGNLDAFPIEDHFRL